MSALEWLQHFYASQCDGEWEHQHGVQIDTLDNPGWMIRVDLPRNLKSAPFPAQHVERGADNWYHCEVAAGVFQAACGTRNLDEVIALLRDWTAEHQGRV